VLTNSQVRDIHIASLEVLERVGVIVQSESILRIFSESGADVDPKNKKVRLPEYLINEALNKVPSQVILCGRNPENDILLEDHRVYYGLGGSPVPYMIDLETGEWIRPTRRNVADVTRLGDALPKMDFIMSLGGAFDAPYELQWLYEIETMLNNTEKPIVYSVSGVAGARLTLEMAAAVVGSDEIKKRPILAGLAQPATPLVFHGTTESVIEFANAGAPMVFAPGVMPGASSPMTVAGCHVVGNAECLFAITLSQLVKPGAPIIYGVHTSNMDMRTGSVLYGHPEYGLGWVVTVQLANYYGVPTFGSGGCTDSKCPDAQAGAEAMGTAIMNALGGINLVHNCGTMAHGTAGCMEMAVISDEIASYVDRLLKGVQVNDETLAVDLIRSVGPGGHFLSQEHTRNSLKRGEMWLSELFNRESREKWKRQGGKDLREVAREKAKKLLAEHFASPLSNDVKNRLAEILKKAERELA